MWFPNAHTPPGPLRARLLCFHNNGSNEGVYTQPDLRIDPSTRKRVRDPNALLAWASQNQVLSTLFSQFSFATINVFTFVVVKLFII
jgi:hypothetical protein